MPNEEFDLSWLPDRDLTWDQFKNLVCRNQRIELNGYDTKTRVEGFLAFLRSNGLATATGYGDEQVIRKLADRLPGHPPERREELKSKVSFTPDPEDPMRARMNALERRIAVLEANVRV